MTAVERWAARVSMPADKSILVHRSRPERVTSTVARREALTAAAVTVNVNAPNANVLWGGAAWQQEAWQHYDTCPELHRATTDMAEAFSRVRMMVVDVDPISGDLGESATDNPTAGAIGARVFGGRTGQAQAQWQIGQHLTVPGECWILASDVVPDVTGQQWQILSVNEVTKAGTMIRIEQLDGNFRYLQDGELLFRMFRPHPKRRWEADSPVRAALPVLRELAGFSAQVIASIKSRLASAGVWLLPQSATLPTQLDDAGNELPGGADAWLRLLGDAMMTAIANPDDPSALIPIISMVPDDVLAKIKDPFQFVRDVITDVQPMREAAVKRLAVGLDQPPERLLGLGTTNHWSAWLLDESFVKGPLSAALSYPADALTRFYLRPALAAAGLNPHLFAIAFDVSMLLPDTEVSNAQQAYDAGVLSERSYLEALDFDPDRDAATPAERAQRLVLTILEKGNPESLEELLPTIKRLFPGIELTVPITTNGPQQSAPVADPATAPDPPAAEPSTTDTRTPPTRPATAPPAAAPTGPAA